MIALATFLEINNTWFIAQFCCLMQTGRSIPVVSASGRTGVRFGVENFCRGVVYR